MMNELIINGKDAYEKWGASMGDGFLSTIEAPCPMKSYVENSSRLNNGKKMITSTARVDSREMNLTFYIRGKDEKDYTAKKNAFVAELYRGAISLQVPSRGEDVYKLVYLGKNISYGLNRSRSFSKLTVRFCEPNPTDRTIV